MISYFFDNNISKRIVRALRELGVRAEHLTDNLPATTPDTEWIAYAADKGHIGITADRKIRTEQVELEVLKAKGLSVCWICPRVIESHLWPQAQWFVKYWPVIDDACAKAGESECFDVSIRGKVKLFRLP